MIELINMKASSSPFRSNFYLWHGVSAIFFSNCLTNVHSHNTMQILVDLQDHFRCRVGSSDWQSFKNLVIRENVPHQLDTAGSVQLIIYLDAETTIAHEIRTRYLEGKEACAPDLNLFDYVKPNELQQALLRPNPALLLTIIGQLLRTLAGQDAATPKSDGRIATVERLLSSTPPADSSIDWLAAQVHLFGQQATIPFQTANRHPALYKYVLWAWIRFAINRIMAGSPINESRLGSRFYGQQPFP